MLLYKEHECLLKKHTLMFWNKQDRKSTLKEITANMALEDFATEDVKPDIKYLWVNFQKEQSKINKSERSRGRANHKMYKSPMKRKLDSSAFQDGDRTRMKHLPAT
jgi:hypothetical protein